MTLYQILTDEQTGVGIPVAYSHFTDKDAPEAPPYLVYLGNGQDTFKADDTFYYSENRYQLEYYFTEKDESEEAAIEKCLLDNGYRYQKSEDVYIEDEGVFVIYYQI
jgi:hypothetical protein